MKYLKKIFGGYKKEMSEEELTKKVLSDISSSVIKDMVGKAFREKEDMIDKEKEVAKKVISDIGTAVVNEMVSRAFIEKEKVMVKEWQKIEEENNFIKRDRLELEAVNKFGSISVLELKKKIDDLNEDYHKNLRRVKTFNDDSDMKAQSIKHTIDFINKII